MNNNFYVYINGKCQNKLGLQAALKLYGDNKTDDYKAIGITQGDNSVDLVNNLGENHKDKISNDYQYSIFKDNKLVINNIIPILKRYLSI